MERICLPASYALLPASEQRDISGGGELKDAAGDFFGNLHVDGLTFHKSFISVSFTFVPLLLFNLIRVSFGVLQGVSGGVNLLFKRSSQAGTKMLDYTSSAISAPASN